MNIFAYIKQVTPPIIYDFFAKVYNRHRKLHQSPLPKLKEKTEKMILIGNGPSLNKSIELYKEEILKYDRLVVNFFALSEQYEVLQPNFYLFVDPAFFEIPESHKNSIERLIDAIVNKTTWEMLICAPEGTENTPLVQALQLNQNIQFVYFFSGHQKVAELTKFEMWDRNLIAPPSQNSLNVGLYLSLYWGYNETYLIGADMSSIEDIRIDQETNQLLSVDTHFYNNKKVYSDINISDSKRGRVLLEWTLHEYIYALGRMFEGFYELSEYAEYKGLKVYNACEYSLINCFERKKLK